MDENNLNIKYKILFNNMDNEGLLDYLVEMAQEEHTLLSFEFDRYYEKLALLKETLLERLSCN